MDFVLSIAIFLSMLFTLMSVWSTIDIQIRDLESRRDIQTLSVTISDSLVRSSGNPIDWNSTNVQSIGLANSERVLSLRKIHELMKIQYYEVKSKLRVGSTNIHSPEKTYDFFMFFTDMDGNNLTTGIVRSPVGYFGRDPSHSRALLDINNSEVIWDLYWGNNPGSLPGDAGTYTHRVRYANNPLNRLNQLIANHSAYRTMVIENAEINALGFTNSDIDLSALQEFVSNGGILIVIGQAPPGSNIIDQNFSLIGDYNNSGWGDGNATSPGYAMPDTQDGERVTFTDSAWLFRSETSQLEKIVTYPLDSDACMVCAWQYGFGKVYYFNDVDGSTEAGLPLLDHVNDDAFAIVGKPLKFGLSIWMPSQVVKVKRTVMLEGTDRELASLNMFVWIERQ